MFLGAILESNLDIFGDLISDTEDKVDKLYELVPCNKTLIAAKSNPNIMLKASTFTPVESSDSNGLCGLGFMNCLRNRDDEMQKMHITHIPDFVVGKIFCLLNHGDLLQCRLVCTHWNALVSNLDYFLDKTVYKLTTDPEVGLQVFGTFTPYRNTKFQYIDYEVYLKKADFNIHYSQNHFFHPSVRFLMNIHSLEFKQCFITWDTLKRILVSTKNLRNLIISQCILTEEFCNPGKARNATLFSDTVGNLREITIVEKIDLAMINEILGKLLRFATPFLETIDIRFKPQFTDCTPQEGDIETFRHSLLHIIQVNAPTLKQLHLNLDDGTLINRIPHILAKLEGFWKVLQLTSFQLSSSRAMKITQQSIEVTRIFNKFFKTQQKLTAVTIPLISTLCEQEKEILKSITTTIIQSLPKTIKYLNLPSSRYLGKWTLATFPSLTSVLVGNSEEILGNNPFNFPEDETESVATWKNLKQIQLEIWRCAEDHSDVFKNIFKKFPQLTTLAINTKVPVIKDSDLQVLIGNLSLLRSLTISHSRYITDFGISGAPLDMCERMFSMGTHVAFQDTVFVTTVLGDGKPLSQLKGLRHLSLGGKSTISDFGVNFGIRFLELQFVCLPWCENITDWGIKRLGDQNPSLETVVMCGVNDRSLDGLNTLAVSHYRIKKNHCSFKVRNRQLKWHN